MARQRRSRMAWAIKYVDRYRGKFTYGLIGYGYFNHWERPDHLSGYVVATFETRRQVREQVKRLNENQRKHQTSTWRTTYRVARVRVSVEER